MKIAHLPSAVQLAAEQVKKKTFKANDLTIGSQVEEKGQSTKDQGGARGEGLGTKNRRKDSIEIRGHRAKGIVTEAPDTKHQRQSNEHTELALEELPTDTKPETLSAKRQPPPAKRPASTTKLPSIEVLKGKVFQKPEAKQGAVDDTSIRSEAFSKKDLVKYWQQFAEEKRKEGKQQEFLVLNQDPQLVDDYTVQIPLNSSVQIDTVDRLKSELMPFLREKLKNDGLKLEAELQMDESKPLIYTPAEKFKYLAEKHPALKVLQEKLGLDPDF